MLTQCFLSRNFNYTLDIKVIQNDLFGQKS